jgi:hypothetical protein
MYAATRDSPREGYRSHPRRGVATGAGPGRSASGRTGGGGKKPCGRATARPPGAIGQFRTPGSLGLYDPNTGEVKPEPAAANDILQSPSQAGSPTPGAPEPAPQPDEEESPIGDPEPGEPEVEYEYEIQRPQPP